MEYDAEEMRGGEAMGNGRGPSGGSAMPRKSAMRPVGKALQVRPASARPAPAARTPAARGPAASNHQVEDLTSQLMELRLSVGGLEKERDFYFGKLREIE